MSLINKFVIETDNDHPHLLITAGVHGDEFESIRCIHTLINQLPGNLLKGKLTLVPCVNTEAFLLGNRTAADELDLARICPGDPNGTITMRVGHELSQLIRTADYYIDLHTGGIRFSVHPVTVYHLHPDQQVLDCSKWLAKSFNLPFIWGTDWRLPGRSMSIACEYGIPAIYAEYLGGAQCSEEGVSDYINGCLNVLGRLGMMNRVQPNSRVKTIVEDPRRGSGHMQVCHPAEFDGFFTPTYSLGDTVQQGDVLGTVRTIDGRYTSKLIANQNGTVIVLRTFSMVRKGEATVVIA